MSHRTDYQLNQICKYNKDGSQNTKETRHRNLIRFIKHMQENRGYSTHWELSKVGKKEVHRYVHDLKEKGLADRTIENNLKDIRWLASKLNREKLIPSNRECGLKKREFSNENKAVTLNASHLAMMDKRMQLINRLKFEFGLREKEALKFSHQEATGKVGKIHLKGTWCKNGRPRSLPIVNERQVQLLKEVGVFQKERGLNQYGKYSMIPNEKKFSSYRNEVQENSKQIGIKGHGLRHHWAHQRFQQLSGLVCPIAGGIPYKDLSSGEQDKWDYAAGVVNQELGHGEGRLDTTATYIGTR